MTPSFTASEIVESTGGELVHGQRDSLFSGVSIDSRNIGEGELFWAIKGEHHNGNDYVYDALEKGAAGVVSDKAIFAPGLPGGVVGIKVAASLAALQRLASHNRQKNPVPLVAITGSNGKTTTKEITASILKKRFEVLKNEGNLNNLIGVPLTLLKLHSDHEVAVVEMGMNRRGEIHELTTMARPDIGVITNIGEAHLEGLGHVENIKRAKGELVEAMEGEHKVILNADDPAVMELAKFARGEVITFGFDGKAHVRAEKAEVEWGKGTLFILEAGEKRIPVLLPIYGIHQLYNALAASTVAYAMGFELEEMREGLEEYESYSGRMEIISKGGITIINDSYNANPPSLRSAIETMIKLADGRKIAVLGDMLELGETAPLIHSRLGRYVHEKGVDMLVTFGALAEKIAEGAVNSGMDSKNVHAFDDKSELIRYLKDESGPGDWLLVKGSRGMKMEEITAALTEDIDDKGRDD
ncbi:MAG: UDP-N-acetylmuramoyl-tripeptide--D-alanyl-D-alanine ligase [Deltaproteobacteria bacterium]|nr:UDP-N-acetylmuramoyl-tripeptide--D-alanyl-D-alanine ligase [Deltaproteobacteria bacterium]